MKCTVCGKEAFTETVKIVSKIEFLVERKFCIYCNHSWISDSECKRFLERLRGSWALMWKKDRPYQKAVL